MTGVASDDRFSAKVRFVDVKRHLNHAAGGLFLWLVVLPVTVIFGDVAVIAPHAERGSHLVHHGQKLRIRHSFKNLNVFSDLLDRLIVARGLGVCDFSFPTYRQKNKKESKNNRIFGIGGSFFIHTFSPFRKRLTPELTRRRELSRIDGAKEHERHTPAARVE